MGVGRGGGFLEEHVAGVFDDVEVAVGEGVGQGLGAAAGDHDVVLAPEDFGGDVEVGELGEVGVEIQGVAGFEVGVDRVGGGVEGLGGPLFYQGVGGVGGEAALGEEAGEGVEIVFDELEELGGDGEAGGGGGEEEAGDALRGGEGGVHHHGASHGVAHQEARGELE